MEQPATQWTVGAVARRLGIAPATLRTWDRRYGLGPSDHRAGSHRRYTEADLGRLQRMADLVRRGVATADAAALTRHGDESVIARAQSGAVEAGAEAPTALAVPVGDDQDTGESAEGIIRDRRWRRGVSKAAMALDAQTVVRRTETALHSRGVVPTWDALLCPLLIEAGLRWQVTGEGVDIEHLLSDCIAAALHTVVVSAPSALDVRPALLACAADELHQLPLQAMRAALAERRVKVQLLGAATPPAALASAARRIGPAAVVLWSQLRRTADIELLAAVPVLRPRARVFVAGPGWDETRLPDHVERLASMNEAIEALSLAAGLAASRTRSGVTKNQG
jgi:DNA-binding transcriptional MerR regulator